MTEHEVSRTLLKSPPELWAECSDAQSLARHLGEFGEIHITRLEPEETVAWEGALASGTVRLEPSGWGTRVVLAARSARPPAEQDANVETLEASESPAPDGPVEAGAEAAGEAAGEPEATPEPRTPRVSEPPRPADPPPLVMTPWLVRRPSQLGKLLGRLWRRPPTASVPPAMRRPWPAAEDHGTPEEPPIAPEPLREESEPVAESPVTVTTAGARTEAPVAPAPEPPSHDVEAALTAALDSLGRAHHRPFSRS